MCSRDDADLQFSCLLAGMSCTARSKPLVLVVAVVAAVYHMHAHRPQPHGHELVQVLSLGTRAGSLVSSGPSLSVISRGLKNNNLTWTPASCTNLIKQELPNQSHFHPSSITLVRSRSHLSYYASEAVADTLCAPARGLQMTGMTLTCSGNFFLMSLRLRPRWYCIM